MRSPIAPDGASARLRGATKLIAPLIALFSVLAFAPVASAADRTFTTRYTVNTTGSIVKAANTLMTCPTSASGCTTAQTTGDNNAGITSLNNNNYNEVLVNQDTTSGLIDSSSASLTIPAGAKVLFAGLYYGADNTGAGSASVAAENKVSLKVPGAAGYTQLTASQLDTSSQEASRYQGFVDVTSQVSAAGAGTYSVGGVQATTGGDHYAGWSIVVAYQLDTDPARNLTIDDGFTSVAATSAPVTISVGGFKTPPSGTVNTDLGFISYEGDEGFVGDSASLDGTTLTDAAHPSNNFFDSAIANDGVQVTAKTPNYVNQLGYDSSFIKALKSDGTGILPNNATTATIVLTTNGDAYYPGVVTFATDLYAPKISQTKTVTDVTHPGGPVQEGDVLKYDISGTNSGSDGTSNFTVNDPVPANTTYVPGSVTVVNSGGSSSAASVLEGYDATSNSVTWRLGAGSNATIGGNIAPGGNYDVQFEATVNGPANNALPPDTAVKNTATASFTSQSLGVPLTASASANTTVTAPDLAITKTLTSPTPIPAGQPATYSIAVSNAGDAPTQGQVTVSDTLPASETYTSAIGDGWTCNPSTDKSSFTCTRSDALAMNQAYPTITLTAAVDPGASGSLSNTATVAGGGDGNLTNNSSTSTAPSSQSADMSLTKTADKSTVNVGGQVTFTLTATNNGSSNATSVAITDALPNGFSYVSSTQPAGGACTITPNTGTVSCQVGTLAPNKSAAATITAQALASASGTSLTNTATVGAQQHDPNMANNTASASVAVSGADLSITNTVDGNPSSLGTGSPTGYTLVATNHGPSDTTGVTITDPIPSNLTNVQIDQSSLSPGESCSITNGSLVCTDPALPSGSSITVHFTGTVKDGSAAATLVNTASVSSALVDPDLTNNTATATTPLQADADLSVTKTATPDPATPNTNETYTITVKNAGPDTAKAAQVVDALPPGLSFVSASTGCTNASGTVTCALGDIAAKGTKVVTVTALVAGNASGTLSNSATAGSSTPDPDPSNNTGTSTTAIANTADLSLTKTVDDQAPGQGQTVTYKLTAKNDGPAGAAATTITDALPAGVTYVSDDDNCTRTGSSLSCPVGALASGASAVVDVKVTVNPVATKHPGQTLALNVEKIETSFSLQPGETQTDRVTCPGAANDWLLTDGSAEITAVDQGTGNLASVNVLDAFNDSPNSFTVELQNTATGQAQGHITGVCLGTQTQNGQQSGIASALSESNQVQSSNLLLAGEHTITETCGPNQTAIDPGFQFDAPATIRSSEPSASGSAWTFIVDVPEQANATMMIRCLNNTANDGQGDVNPLRFTTQTVNVSVPPSTGSGFTQPSVICPNGYEGIVASYTVDPGLVMIGDDPQPITRVFSIYNPTSGNLNASLDLLCVADNTGGEVSQATITNSATASSTTEDPDNTNNTASASFTANGNLTVAGSSQHALSANPATVEARTATFRSGRIAFELQCAAGQTCMGVARATTTSTVTVNGKRVRAGVVLGSVAYTARSGHVKLVEINVKHKYVAVARRIARVRLSLTARNSGVKVGVATVRLKHGMKSGPRRHPHVNRVHHGHTNRVHHGHANHGHTNRVHHGHTNRVHRRHTNKVRHLRGKK